MRDREWICMYVNELQKKLDRHVEESEEMNVS